jgi:hypothetical protein
MDEVFGWPLLPGAKIPGPVRTTRKLEFIVELR